MNIKVNLVLQPGSCITQRLLITLWLKAKNRAITIDI